MTEKQKQFDEILKTLEEIKGSKEPKSKDLWDKLGILGQIVSGILLVALGLYLTSSIDSSQKDLTNKIAESQIRASKENIETQANSAKSITDAQIKSSQDISQSQRDSSAAIANLQVQSSAEISRTQTNTQNKIAEAQVATSRDISNAQVRSQEFAQKLNFDTLNRQLAADYLGKLITASNAVNDRSSLLNSLDIALTPQYAIPIAIHFTRPIQIQAEICGGKVHEPNDLIQQSKNINSTAIALLERLRLKDSQSLEKFTRSKYKPDAAIAESILGVGTRVLFRISEVDDFADIYINNKVTHSYKYSQESEWKDITNEIDPTQGNQISVVVRNGQFAGTGVRFEIQVGAEQFDEVIHRTDGLGFGINFAISVDEKGGLHLNGENIAPDIPIGNSPCLEPKTN